MGYLNKRDKAGEAAIADLSYTLLQKLYKMASRSPYIALRCEIAYNFGVSTVDYEREHDLIARYTAHHVSLKYSITMSSAQDEHASVIPGRFLV